MEKQYRRFNEYCEWEGEGWNFYIPIDGNEQALWELEQLITQHSADQYQLKKDPVGESEVDILVKNAEAGYLHSDTKLTGTLDISSLRNLSDEDFDEALYKGGIRHLMK